MGRGEKMFENHYSMEYSRKTGKLL